MNHGGDAAEQIVRMSLEGVEVAVRLTGAAAKEIALLLLAALKSPETSCKTKLKGKERLNTMLKSGKPLEIFSVKESDLKKFSQAAKEYGIVYCVLRNTKDCPDKLVDVMVKADDAPKISRIVERFNFATVDKAKIESEIVADRAERMVSKDAPEAPDINATDKLLDDLMGVPENNETDKLLDDLMGQRDAAPNAAPSAGKEGKAKDNRPLVGSDQSRSTEGAPKNRPSEPTLESEKKLKRTTSSRPSVKEELREIKAARKAREADAPRRDAPAAEKPQAPPTTTHQQPQRGKFTIKRAKER